LGILLDRQNKRVSTVKFRSNYTQFESFLIISIGRHCPIQYVVNLTKIIELNNLTPKIC